jgi:hypothetical protein
MIAMPLKMVALERGGSQNAGRHEIIVQGHELFVWRVVSMPESPV